MQQSPEPEKNQLQIRHIYKRVGLIDPCSPFFILFKPLYCYQACRETIICRYGAKTSVPFFCKELVYFTMSDIYLHISHFPIYTSAKA